MHLWGRLLMTCQQAHIELLWPQPPENVRQLAMIPSILCCKIRFFQGFVVNRPLQYHYCIVEIQIGTLTAEQTRFQQESEPIW